MRSLAAIALIFLPAAAQAEVVHSESHGFEVSRSVDLARSPAEALTAFTQVANWWSKDHTYSGDPANLSLDARPGGCFCERFPGGGGIEHMRVTYFEPGQFLILTGALGPLLHEAVAGVMRVQVEKIAGGSRLTIDYRAAGFANGGAGKMAPRVDAMLGESINRYRSYADSGIRR
jgi:uncharacterized protein YndB with AHSA1/START domain